MTTDAISDFITRLRNAGKAGKPFVVLPYSKFTEAVLSAMERSHYIESFAKKGKKVGRSVEVKLSYDAGGHRIQGIRRISKPSRRLYTGLRNIRPVKNGFGALLLSTPKGVLTDKEARREKVGGEMILEVW